MPTAENAPLNALLGLWRSSGQTLDIPSVRIIGTDEYTWFPGEHFLLHRVDVRFGGEHVEALEMIGPYDPATGGYPMRAFDNRGVLSEMTAAVDAEGVWTFTGPDTRATLRIAESVMAARWERLVRGEWTHWMDMSFSRA
ncbi:hypothetical protein [Crossiella cryophila]|uniref:DUF1579 domain-containing protein n=1 Tax=Crossiella cryophila TaxID=43355 RepID=A0A7W7CGC8_9PSEU|nr:hypothetical protein [Crossiella cryophila]MBB4679321.1 hypothetical protein [Crossiella cryophila]